MSVTFVTFEPYFRSMEPCAECDAQMARWVYCVTHPGMGGAWLTSITEWGKMDVSCVPRALCDACAESRRVLWALAHPQVAVR